MTASAMTSGYEALMATAVSAVSAAASFSSATAMLARSPPLAGQNS